MELSDKCRQVWKDYINGLLSYREFVRIMAELASQQEEIKFGGEK
jgi:hypothetical protein